MGNFWGKIKDFFNIQPMEDENEEIDISYAKPMPLDEKFINYFTKANGYFLYCENESEVLLNLKQIQVEEHISRVICFDEKLQIYLNTLDINYVEHPSATADFNFLFCESLIAHNGSIMLSSAVLGGRKLNDLPDGFIILAYYDQIVNLLGDGLKKILSREKKLQKNEGKNMINGITSIGGIDANPMDDEPAKKTIYLLLLD